MKKILLISDNSQLTKFFKKIASKMHATGSVKFLADYAYSKKNRSPESMTDLGCFAIDLLDKNTIDHIPKTYDLVLSIHCKQIFPPEIVSKVCCVNLHPGLNPHNRGWYPQVFSIINKKPAGATLHYMDEEIDHGGIISQSEIKIYSWDTSLDVYNRVIEAEKKLIEDNLQKLIEGNATSTLPETDGNYNSISDFRSLCQLKLNRTGTLGEHIDLLRALSHGEFKNAHYIDNDGNKVFVRIELVKENILFNND